MYYCLVHEWRRQFKPARLSQWHRHRWSWQLVLWSLVCYRTKLHGTSLAAFVNPHAIAKPPTGSTTIMYEETSNREDFDIQIISPGLWWLIISTRIKWFISVCSMFAPGELWLVHTIFRNVRYMRTALRTAGAFWSLHSCYKMTRLTAPYSFFLTQQLRTIQ